MIKKEHTISYKDDCDKRKVNPKRYERCVYCGEIWNVSILDETPWYEYECPKCEIKRKKKRSNK